MPMLGFEVIAMWSSSIALAMASSLIVLSSDSIDSTCMGMTLPIDIQLSPWDQVENSINDFVLATNAAHIHGCLQDITAC